ncbi:MAG: 50S ribosomal protein L7/L12 [Patescibacteria group bacterium]|nr:50S ribosomal protein L7/L12 [Patescibacteria group bacterium]
MTDETKKEKELSKNLAKLVDEIASLSVLELSELVNALQDKLGVTAQAPMMAMPTTATTTAATPAGDTATSEQSAGGGTVVMTNAGANKIAVIKALREINQNWGLKEAKDMTENVPAEILKNAKPEEVKVAVEKLKAAGATVEIK